MNNLYSKITSNIKPEDGFISFDVFDTLITRSFLPETVLKGLARYIISSNGIEPSDENVTIALRLRGAAWEELLKIKKISNPRVEDALSVEMLPIWIDLLAKEFKTRFESDQDSLIKISKFEVNLEKFSMKPVKVFLDLTKKLKNDGYKMIFISDMYLSAGDILSILEDCGYINIFDECYSSGEVGLLKRTGSIFRIFSENAKSISFHIGDDAIADKVQPARSGIKCLQYISNEVKTAKRTSKRNELLFSRQSAQRAMYLNKIAIEKMRQQQISADSYVQAFSNFILTLAQIIQKNNFPTILPAREGLLIGTGLYSVEDIFGNMSLHYAPFSRSSVTPILYKGSPKDFIKLLLENNQETSWIDICNVLEIPHFEGVQIALQTGIKNTLEKFNLNTNNGSLIRISRNDLFLSYWNVLISKKEVQVANWIEENLGKPEEVNFVDLGWNGTIQSNLAPIISENTLMTGIYFGLKTSSEQHETRNSKYYSLIAYQNNDFASHIILDLPQLLEIKTLAPHSSIEEIDSSVTNLDTITNYLNQNPNERKRIALHVNVLKYIEILKIGHWIVYPKINSYKQFIATVVSSCLVFPSKQDVLESLKLETNMGFKSKKFYSIVFQGKSISAIRKSHWKVGSALLSRGRFFSLLVFLRHQLRWNLTDNLNPTMKIENGNFISPRSAKSSSSKIFGQYFDFLKNEPPATCGYFAPKIINLRVLMVLSNLLRFSLKLPKFNNYNISVRSMLASKIYWK